VLEADRLGRALGGSHRMDESFSPTILLYGMALVLAVGKAFTLTIWRTLPKLRPGLRQEMLQAWESRRLRKQAVASPVGHPAVKRQRTSPREMPG
jgi:hypothetical protein